MAAPPGNLLPSSCYMLSRIVDASNWQSREHHVCDREKCQGHVWEPLPRKAWPAHQDDECPHCGERRFVKQRRGGKDVLEPYRYYIDFGLINVIKDYFNDPAWCALRGTSRNLDEEGSWWQGTECQRLIARVRELNEAGADYGFDVMHKDTSGMEVMLDWVEPYGSVTYSVGVVGIRCPDIGARNKGKSFNSRPVLIIPGPKQPKNIVPYFQKLLEGFDALSRHGVQVTEQLDGQAPRTFTFYTFLSAVVADSPARIKLSKCGYIGSYFPCGFCINQGVGGKQAQQDVEVAVDDSTTKTLPIYPMGYCEEQPQNMHYSIDEPFKAKVGDPRLQLSHADHLARAEDVESGNTTAKEAGCQGLSCVIAKLPYVDYNNIWLVPVSHALLFGLVKSFWQHVLRSYDRKDPPETVVPYSTRTVMAERGKHFAVPSEFGRKYKCVLQYNGQYTMEDWLHFALAFSPYICSPEILPDVLEKMWRLLVTVVAHYMHAATSYTDSSSKAAAAALLDYAKLVEQHFDRRQCTFNLHMLVCRLRKQEEARGAASQDLEQGVERLMQMFKAAVGRRVTSHPEKAFVTHKLMDEALQQWRRTQPDLKSFEELCGGKGVALMLGRTYDKASNGQILLRGAGKQLCKAERTSLDLAAILKRYITDNNPHGWEPKHIDKILQRTHANAETMADVSRNEAHKAESREVLRFTYAEVNGATLQGEEHGKVKSRVNYMISVKYEGYSYPWMGKLEHFLRIPHPDWPEAQIEPLRIAIVTFYEPCERESTNSTLLGSLRPPGMRATGKAATSTLRMVRVDTRRLDKGMKGGRWPVDPHAILNKHVVAFAGGKEGATELFCMTYNSLTAHS